MMMNTRYEVVDGEIVKICEERTSYSLASAAALLNQENQHMEQLDERIAELETSQKSEYESNKIRNKHDIEVREELRSALGGKFDVGVTTPGLIRALAKERDGYKARIKELEAAQTQPAVTPEWLAEVFRDALAAADVIFEPWRHTPPMMRGRYITAAKRVLDQMPKAAPVVDVERLIEDYQADRAGHGLQQHCFYKGSLRYALKEQGISCK